MTESPDPIRKQGRPLRVFVKMLFIGICGSALNYYDENGQRNDIWILICVPLGLAVSLTVLALFASRFYDKHAGKEKVWCREHGWTWLGGRPPWKRGVADFKSGVERSRLGPTKHTRLYDVLIREKDGEAPAIFCRDLNENRSEYQGISGEFSAFLIVRYAGDCPDMTIESRRFTMLPELKSRKRIQFESAEFNEHWKVTSDDAKAAYDRIDQSTIEFLERQEIRPSIELIDQLLLIVFKMKSRSWEEREKCLRWAESFSRAVPDDLMAPIKLLNDGP